MEQNTNNGLFKDLTNQEMIEVNGGSTVGELIAKVLGFCHGFVSKLQVRNGDTGQWLA
ncbi:MAG TPA: hypothetical protein VFP20_05800 [Bacteroidales bacterium]|nr:hypothetical protein [Bacteroidales bacterium]